MMSGGKIMQYLYYCSALTMHDILGKRHSKKKHVCVCRFLQLWEWKACVLLHVQETPIDQRRIHSKHHVHLAQKQQVKSIHSHEVGRFETSLGDHPVVAIIRSEDRGSLLLAQLLVLLPKTTGMGSSEWSQLIQLKNGVLFASQTEAAIPAVNSAKRQHTHAIPGSFITNRKNAGSAGQS